MNRCYMRATQGLLILAILVMLVGFLLAQVRAQGYEGPLAAGVDLMEITIGADVTIRAPTQAPLTRP
jgi:hypothetical protein